MSKFDVFISYSRKDSAIADKVCQALDSAGISYFIDRQGIGGGFEFPVVLADAICDSSLFLFLASNNSYESKFTNNELTFAFNELPRQSILPYIIDGSEMPRTLRFIFSSVNWRNINEHPIETVLIQDLRRLLGKPEVEVVQNVKQPPQNEDIRVGATVVILEDAGPAKLSVVKYLKELNGCSLLDAKIMADTPYSVIKKGITKEEALKIKAELEEIGATVSLK